MAKNVFANVHAVQELEGHDVEVVYVAREFRW